MRRKPGPHTRCRIPVLAVLSRACQHLRPPSPKPWRNLTTALQLPYSATTVFRAALST
jgi:hypothetical protein